MLPLALLCLLVGMVLGQRFKVLILAPSMIITLGIIIGTGIVRAEPPWTLGLSAAAAITALQIGYLVGLGIRQLMAGARASRLKSALFANSLPAQRSAR